MKPRPSDATVAGRSALAAGAPRIAVIVPARDEEELIGRCLASIVRAAANVQCATEIIVVLNRCTDRTGAIATSFGARCVDEPRRCLAAVRNSGVRAARAPLLVTIDADSEMSANALSEVVGHLDSGRYVGGGSLIWPERWSLGIAVSGLALLPYALWHRISAGMFWTSRSAFDAIGGFDESMVSVEDIDFALRLKRYGKTRGQRFGTLLRASITTSCRKFDRFGDWHLLREPRLARALLTGKSREAADRYYYDFRR